MRARESHGRRNAPRPFAVILGTNEIASAIGVRLVRSDFLTVLSHDPDPPVLQRRMSFHDALFDETVSLAGVTARRVESGLRLLTEAERPDTVLITRLGLLDLIVLRKIDVLVDARMQKYQATPDLRGLAGITIGVGPGFCAGRTCGVAVETWPERVGQIVAEGCTLPPDGVPRLLHGKGPQRFVSAPVAGLWHTAVEIGMRVYKDLLLGTLGGIGLHAPFDGTLRGLVRDGTEVPPGAKLCEIDPRARGALWRGIEDRAGAIADGAMRALKMQMETPSSAPNKLYVVK